ncbi:MAG: hypothetical protein HY516_00405 [Candidatus Aenigmarchaeota archaeon]|nr:hypothetical protein [Candidatus Aenigmarchaeota archaeon]
MPAENGFEAINRRDNARNQSGYGSKIKGRGIDKPAMVMEYTENVRDGNTDYTVTVKNYVWQKGFRIPVGQYAKPDHEAMIFITNNATGRTHALTYSHNERVYWKNVKPGKDGKYEVRMPTSWHTPTLAKGTYEKVSWDGSEKGIKKFTSHIDPREGRATLWYTKGAQKFAEMTQKILRHAGQELPETVMAVPINPEKPSAFYKGKNTLTSDVRTAFTRPSELYQRMESSGSKRKK